MGALRRMTSRALALGALLWAAPAAGEDEPAAPADDTGETPPGDDAGGEEPTPDDTLSRYRTPFPVLVERTIGNTSKSVEFNWRRSRVQLAANGNHLFELNNFNSLRAGGMARIPSGGLIFELGLSHVWAWDTPSSELLALTPYRQPGRPPHLDLDFDVGIPLAEGVVTTFPRWFPAVELVFNAYGGLRYALYPTAFGGMKLREVAGAVVSPALTETEIDNLDDKRLDAMQVDPGRYGLVAGFGTDLYFRQGVFVSPRALFSVPVLAPAAGSELLFWADLSVVIGVAL